MDNTNTPKQGQIVYMNFVSQEGYGQLERKPAVVVSCNRYNLISNVHLVCPISEKEQRNPYRIPLDERTRTSGFIMCDQVKMLNLAERAPQHIEYLPHDILMDVCDAISGILRVD